MKKLSIVGLSVAIAAGAAALFSSPASSVAAEQTFVTIGTGGVTGVYYPAGGAICRLLNQGRKEHGIRCSVESTGGSVYNINTIRAGELDFGVAQSDWQYHAYHGSSVFADAGPFEDLRAVFSMHPEPMTLVVRSDAGIDSYADLKGKRVNIGNPGSGARATVDVMLKESGIDPQKDFSVAAELAAAEQAGALCDNKVDAIFFSVGHPSGTIKEATTACDSKLVDITGPGIEKMVDENAFYSWATIPGGMYRGTDSDVKTFGVRATLVTSAKVPDEAVYELVKSVFENFDSFKKLHPAFANLTKEEMVSASLSAPLHPGAAKYYKEVGLIK